MKYFCAGPKWTAREVLAHVADGEVVNLWRFFRAVAEPGSTVEAFEQEPWARALDYAKRPVTLSRDLFLSARKTPIHYVLTLEDSGLEAEGDHPEKGVVSGWRWARLAFDHGNHYLEQVEAAISGRPWVRKTRDVEGSIFGAGP